jgi:hypothetical protein
MNRLISASAFLCSTLGLVLMILACFLAPHHVVLGDDGGATTLWLCSLCSEADCQAKYSQPNCSSGTCPPGWISCRGGCGCGNDTWGGTYYCDCQ